MGTNAPWTRARWDAPDGASGSERHVALLCEMKDRNSCSGVEEALASPPTAAASILRLGPEAAADVDSRSAAATRRAAACARRMAQEVGGAGETGAKNEELEATEGLPRGGSESCTRGAHAHAASEFPLSVVPSNTLSQETARGK